MCSRFSRGRCCFKVLLCPHDAACSFRDQAGITASPVSTAYRTLRLSSSEGQHCSRNIMSAYKTLSGKQSFTWHSALARRVRLFAICYHHKPQGGAHCTTVATYDNAACCPASTAARRFGANMISAVCSHICVQKWMAMCRPPYSCSCCPCSRALYPATSPPA